MKKPYLFSLLILIIVGIALFPTISLATILIINAAIAVLVGLFRIFGTWLPAFRKRVKPITHEPFVSIQIACYNEPPELLFKTLDSLKNLDYNNFEVIILDNNTPDKAVWQPVKKYVETLGEKFRFFHFDNVKNYKAGALNICMQQMNPATEYILVLDADYAVAPNILHTALPHFSDEKVGLVQFPQAYYNTDKTNRALEHEYALFFSLYMNLANHFDSVLATGTVSFLRRSALEKVGGWVGQSITEDVELGLNLQKLGLKGVFIPETLGKGLMPADLESIQIQRERWVFGNMQTLKRAWEVKHHFSGRKNGAFWLLLTAWFNFMLIPSAVILLGVVTQTLGFTFIPASIIGLAVGSLCLELFLTLILFLIPCGVCLHKTDLITRFKSFLIHLGLAWQGAFNWWKVLITPEMPFKRTNKFLSLTPKLEIPKNIIWALLVAVIPLLYQGYFIAIGSIILSTCLLAGAGLIRYNLQQTHRISKQNFGKKKPVFTISDKPVSTLV